MLSYPGWENERPCAVGLLGAADGAGRREVDAPLAEELRRQRAIFAALTGDDRLAGAAD